MENRIESRAVEHRGNGEAGRDEPVSAQEWERRAEGVPGADRAGLWVRLAPLAALLASVLVALRLIEAPEPGAGSWGAPGTAPGPPGVVPGQANAVGSVPAPARRAPRYRRPVGAEARPRAADPDVPVAPAPLVEVLAPEHVARTEASAPRLAWFIAPLPAPGSAQFSLAEEGGEAPRVRAALPWPQEAGVQILSLDRLGIALEAGRTYRWTIQVRAGDAHSPWSARARASILRVPEDVGAGPGVLRASREERALRLAAEGLWYDALAEVLAEESPWSDRALRALMRDAGLEHLEVAFTH